MACYRVNFTFTFTLQQNPKIQRYERVRPPIHANSVKSIILINTFLQLISPAKYSPYKIPYIFIYYVDNVSTTDDGKLKMKQRL